MKKTSKRRRRIAGYLDMLLNNEHLWSVLAVLAIVLVIGSQLAARNYDYTAGDIVDDDILAPIDLRVPDLETTQQRREQATVAVLDLYDFDPFAYRESVQSLNSLFAWGRERIEAVAQADSAGRSDTGPAGLPARRSWEQLDAVQQEAFVRQADEIAGLSLPSGLVAALWREGYTAPTELAAEAALRNQVQRSMIGTTEVIGAGGRRAITVRDIGNQQERNLADLSSISDLNVARMRIRVELREDLGLPVATEEALSGLLGLLLRPNLTYNSNETQARRQLAAETVDPVFYQVKRGRAIVRAGDSVDTRVQRELDALRVQWVGGGSSTAIWGVALLVAAAVMSSWRYVQHHRRRWRFQRVRRLHQLVLLVLVVSILMTRFMLFVGDAIARSMMTAPFSVGESYRYAAPYAVGALVLMLLADAHVAWVYAAVQAVVLATMTGDVGVAIYSMLGSFAAIYGMSRFSQRTQLMRTGLTVGLMNVVVVVGLALMAQPPPGLSLTAFQIGLGIFGGLQVALLAAAMLPTLEHVFNTLTDVKLLELSNMTLPLLKQLAVAAPGTYHHSVVIGTLAEKAAEAIRANSLFTRVAAYYHDVGKISQPEYFIENQKDKRNPHSKLAPHMSALILLRHVKDGAALGREHHLPRPLIDIIEQHHGTRLMRFFYEKARGLQDPETGTVDEREFRYPGPKPQTKEAALIMLADGVEAMSRLLDDPSAANLQAMIGKNSRLVMEDKQLDECDITMAELAKVEQAFFDVLSGMHHHRVEYPEQTSVPAEPATEATAP